MSKDLQVLKFDNLRCYQDDLGNVWLNLEDVCIGLGFTEISKSGNLVVRWRTIRQYLKDLKCIATSCDGIGNENLPEFIKENIFYRLCMKAKNKLAENFQIWVADIVIPQVRKTGGYIPISKEDDEKLILAKAVQILNRTIKEKDNLIEQYQPKVEFYNTLIESDSLFDMKTVAKLLDCYNLGRNRLFQFLRSLKILMKNNEPYQSYVERGWFKVKEKLVNGEFIKITYTTNKGIEGIKNLLDKYGYKKRDTEE